MSTFYNTMDFLMNDNNKEMLFVGYCRMFHIPWDLIKLSMNFYQKNYFKWTITTEEYKNLPKSVKIQSPLFTVHGIAFSCSLEAEKRSTAVSDYATLQIHHFTPHDLPLDIAEITFHRQIYCEAVNIQHKHSVIIIEHDNYVRTKHEPIYGYAAAKWKYSNDNDIDIYFGMDIYHIKWNNGNTYNKVQKMFRYTKINWTMDECMLKKCKNVSTDKYWYGYRSHEYMYTFKSNNSADDCWCLQFDPLFKHHMLQTETTPCLWLSLLRLIPGISQIDVKCMLRVKTNKVSKVLNATWITPMSYVGNMFRENNVFMTFMEFMSAKTLVMEAVIEIVQIYNDNGHVIDNNNAEWNKYLIMNTLDNEFIELMQNMKQESKYSVMNVNDLL
eukprot:366504_1